MTFLETLVAAGIVPENQVAYIKERAEEKYDGDLDQALVEASISEATILEQKSKFYNIPAKTVDIHAVTFEALKYIPEDSAKHYQFVPLTLLDGVLEIGVLDPANIEALDALQFIASKLGLPYKVFLISRNDFNRVLENYKGLSGEVDRALTELDTEIADAADVSIENNKIQDKLKPGEEEKIVEEAPIIKIVAVILNHATEGNASDIHIENTGEKVKVRFRIDGVLHTSLVLPINVYAGVVARIKILAKLRLDEKRKPQDGGFSAKVGGRKIDFRVSTLPAYYGEKVEMRILDSERGVKPLNALGLSERHMTMIRDALARPYGLILITGPTGSGKSTTLYSMLNELDREKSNVISLEDPVEYHIPDMNQSQVMPEIGYTFASGLRSILRQDPDIIMVGEIRDKETAQLAIQAALTGHLVFSTLHTNNAIGVIPRLIDMGVDPYLIAPTLTLSIAQRLVRVICPNSQKALPLDDSTKQMLTNQFVDLPEAYRKEIPFDKSLYEAIPSTECPSGTRGRVAVVEMFAVDKEVRDLILKSPGESQVFDLVRAKGFTTMREDAILKSTQGIVPVQEVYGL